MISDKPGVSVLIPWCQRDELRLTLAANAPFFRAQRAEVLVLNIAGDSGRLHDLIIASEVQGVRQVDISAPRFNKSRALNIGLSHSRSAGILTLDTDIVLLDDAFAVTNAFGDDESFVTVERVLESRPPSPAGNPFAVAGRLGATLVNKLIMEFTFPDGRTVHHQASRVDAFGTMRAGPGILLAKKHDLLEIQGYNSNLENWGWEDDDILIRLQYMRNLRRVEAGAALHLTHGDEQRLPRMGGRSGQLNFLKCLRNYNNGLFLGTLCSDLDWAADKVAESVPDVVTQASRVIPSGGEAHQSGPAECGWEAHLPSGKPRGLDRYVPTIDDLLIEASLTKSSLRNCNLLHVGIGDSRLASRLSPSCRHITGVAMDESEEARAIGLHLPNYHPIICDRRIEEFRAQLPLDTYDIIVDCNFASQVCCRWHWKALMENYSALLGPGGLLLTSRAGLDVSPGDRWVPEEDDLCHLASQFDLDVFKTAYGAYTLRARGVRLEP